MLLFSVDSKMVMNHLESLVLWGEEAAGLLHWGGGVVVQVDRAVGEGGMRGDHAAATLSTGSSASRHSSIPSVSRRALRPWACSRRTAS